MGLLFEIELVLHFISVPINECEKREDGTLLCRPLTLTEFDFCYYSSTGGKVLNF